MAFVPSIKGLRSSARPQLSHGTVVQLLGMKTAASTHLLLRHSTELIKAIRMTFNLGMSRLLPQHFVGMVICPGQKFSCRPLAPLQHIARI